MSVEPWVGDEPRMASVARGVLARALRRPVRVLVIALLTTGAAVAFRALRAPAYEATLHFRLDEGHLADPTLAPRPPRDIRQHIFGVALSRRELEQILRRHGSSEEWLAHDPVAAIDAFREDIKIEVFRNYFIHDRGRRDEPRSAEVTLSLLGSDADRTRAMVHEMGDAILRDQAAQRGARLAEASEHFGGELSEARARTRSLQEATDRLGRDAAGADAGRAIDVPARAAALEAETGRAIARELELERRADDLAFRGAAEDEQLGLKLELVDESLAMLSPHLAPSRLALLAAVILAVVLPLTGFVVGAFDDRVYVPEDLAACGVPLFGALRRFPGDEAGSYRARLSAGRGPP